MATEAIHQQKQQKQEDGAKRHRSVFDLPPDFFDSCRILPSPTSSLPVSEPFQNLSLNDAVEEAIREDQITNPSSNNGVDMQRWSCNTCREEFDSLQEQRSHFKSDLHRVNIKLTIAGKDTVKEEYFDETTSESLCKDNDISSISGSEDEDDKDNLNVVQCGSGRSGKSKLFVQLQTGERVSLFKSLLLDDLENISFEDDKSLDKDDGVNCRTEAEVTEKLKHVINEPRDKTVLRVVLLARGGHFAGCVFDGNSIVAHKTFHRYVVRAKAGKKQSSKDAGGKTIHSAGAALRRYNEFALKKDIQELLATWKPYFASSSSIYIYAPSNNHNLFFEGEKPQFICQQHAIRNVPLTVRRPTFKEARRIYSILTQVSYDVNEEVTTTKKEELTLGTSVKSDGSSGSRKTDSKKGVESRVMTEHCSGHKNLESDNIHASRESEKDSGHIGTSTPLHEAAESGNVQKVLELLEQGLDPCIKDEKGRTPYMLATDKEVRNSFRRFMASNLDKWDWNSAKVPSALTKEMEESQAAKQAEKDAKRKARAKELKKLRKAREKKAEAEAALSQTTSNNHGAKTLSAAKGPSQLSGSTKVSKEEELKRAQDAEREKRAAAAERRIAAMAALKDQGGASHHAASSSQAKNTEAGDLSCSCCHDSLAGKVPFHRFNYKYCSSTCMHLHRDILEDG